MSPSYQAFKLPLVFFDASTLLEINKNRSWPTPLQGESFADCPLMAALASIAWVNRKFIVNSISRPDGVNYTFTFWSYKSALASSTTDANSATGGTVSLGGQLNATDTKTTVAGTKTYITVAPEVLLDGNSRLADPNGTFYGAGSSITNEIWPAVFERAYAKFCFFENNLKPAAGALQCTVSNDALGNTINTVSGPDPTYDDLKSLTMTQWGGNAGIALMYLTGVNCFQCSTTSLAVPTGSSIITVDTSAMYKFIKSAFCVDSGSKRRPNCLNKTRYPLVAVTYPEGCQLGGVKFSPDASQGIVNSHCYAILGTFASPNGHNYIVLRTTFGLKDPSALTGIAPSGYSTWQYNDARFQIGGSDWFPPDNTNSITLKLDLSLGDAVFGLEESVFCNYFQTLAWAEGYK